MNRLNNYLHLLFRTFLLLMILVLSANIATAQRSYRLGKAPFYKTTEKHQVKPNAKIIHLPVMVDEKVNTEFFYQGREQALMPVIEVMNNYLDSLAWSAVTELESIPGDGSPYLFVGSSEAETAPPGAEMMREEFDKFPPMMTFVQKPSKAWSSALKQKIAEQQADYMVLIWLGFNEYPKANKGLFKKKVVLGTDYEPEIRFLSAEDKPVEVLQLTAMLLDKSGEVVRVGAEAFLHEDTPFWAQVMGISKSIDDQSIRESIVNHRREDLPGRPLAWKVGLNTLMQQITQRPNIL